MRGVAQFVKKASVTVENEVVGTIQQGILLLLGIKPEDGEEQVRWMVKKVINLRAFPDEQGKMNRSLIDVEGELLVVSQFTLYGDCSMGRRPSFIGAARPEQAEPLYELFVAEAKRQLKKVATGKFGAKMEVQLVNNGPVTFILDSPE